MYLKRKANLLFYLIVIWNALLIFFLVEFGSVINKEPTLLRLLTATKGGKYYELGNLFGKLSKPNEKYFVFSPEETDGAIDNFNRLTKYWPNTFALGYTKALSAPAFDNSGEYDNMKGNIRCVQILYEEVVQIICRKDAQIRHPIDLTNRDNLRVYIGMKKSGTRFTVKTLFKACGLNKSEVAKVIDRYDKYSNFSYSEAAEKIIAGELDVVVFEAGLPTKAASDLLPEYKEKLELLSIDDEDFIKKVKKDSENMYGVFSGFQITEQDIKGDRYWTNDFKSISSYVMLATHKTFEPEIVYKILDFINNEYFSKIKEVIPNLQDVSSSNYREEIINKFDIKEHVGVKRYLSSYWPILYKIKEKMPYFLIAFLSAIFLLQLYLSLNIAMSNPDSEIPFRPELWKVVWPPLISGIIAVILKMLDVFSY